MARSALPPEPPAESVDDGVDRVRPAEHWTSTRWNDTSMETV